MLVIYTIPTHPQGWIKQGRERHEDCGLNPSWVVVLGNRTQLNPSWVVFLGKRIVQINILLSPNVGQDYNG